MFKNFILISCGLFTSVLMHSQWNYDPANPTVVSNGACIQNKSTQVADGAGGTFVFWLDAHQNDCSSGSHFDVFGQHYDGNGTALWEIGGREILNYATPIVGLAVTRSAIDGEMIIGAHSYISVTTDSLRFQKLDDNGMKVWTEDLLVANADGCAGYYMLGFENFSFYRGEDEYVVNFTPTYCGGSDGNRITRFNSEGVLTGLYNGEPEGNQYYVGSRGIDKTYDGSNDTYLYYTGGNGAGAHAFCMRVTADGDSAWAPIDVLDGTNGLNYQFTGLSDEDGIAFCFQTTGPTATADYYLRKLNSDGSWAWGGNTVSICEFDGYQTNLFMIQDDNFYYMCWADGRPGVVGNYAVYAQKVNKSTGEIQWAQNGVEIFDQNNYSTNPKCVLRSDGKLVVVTQSGTLELGMNAQLVNTDGITIWPTPSVIAIPEFMPFYEQYKVINSNDNIIVAWDKSNPSGGADGIYIAKVATPMTLLEETISACGFYTSNNETFTESGIYTQQLPGDSLLTINLTITTIEAATTLNEPVLSATNTEGAFSWLNCSTGMIEATGTSSFTPDVTGDYALIVELNGCSDTSDCVSVIVIGIEERINKSTLQLFPNPNHGRFNIAGLTNYSSWSIFDSFGKLIWSQQLNHGTLIQLPENLPEGMYSVKITSAEHTEMLRFLLE